MVMSTHQHEYTHPLRLPERGGATFASARQHIFASARQRMVCVYRPGAPISKKTAQVVFASKIAAAGPLEPSLVEGQGTERGRR